MSEIVCIEKQGIVERIVEDTVMVRIRQLSACGSCRAKGLCSLSESADKIIEVDKNTPDISTGDTVNIVISRAMGNKAVVLGYLLPFLLMFTTLILLSRLPWKEWMTGLASVGILVPYYLTLYALRDRLKKTFSFTIRKT